MADLEQENFDRWNTLYQQRQQPGADQAALGPMEHQAFARSVTTESLLGAPAMALAIPAYTAAKAVGLMNNRSPATLEEMSAGYKGIGQGLADRWRQMMVWRATGGM